MTGPDAAGRFIAHMRSLNPADLETLRHQAWCRDNTCPTCDGTGGDHQIGCHHDTKEQQ